MRFPSLETAWIDGVATFRRFPLAILSALVACGALISMIDSPGGDTVPRLFATAALGLPLFTALTTTSERMRGSLKRRWLLTALVAGLLVLLYTSSLSWTPNLTALRFVQLFVMAHLMVAVAPYAASGRLNGFWQYNRFLLLRYLTASFFTLVLWIGLSIALAALDKLFGVKVQGDAYSILMALLAFVFHPWFFLAGVPKDFEALEAREDYPVALKVFSQFVLIPLVTVYLVILTVYLGKVLATRTWPSGWIGYLVSSVSLAGVLALLLVHPIRRRSDSQWVDAYGRWWFVVLIPSLIMLLLAASQRIGQYGLTEPRYFLLALTLWMLGLSLYYGLTGSTNIKLIPETLLLVTVLTALGPWSAYSVSMRSQTGRLDRILAAHAMGRSGAMRPPAQAVSREDREQISAVFRYLERTHGHRALARVLGVPADTVAAWAARTRGIEPVAVIAMRKIGLNYADPGIVSEGVTSFWINQARRPALDVRGFEQGRAVDFPILGWVGSAIDSIYLARSGSMGNVVVTHGPDTLFTLDLAAAIRRGVPADSLEIRRNLLLTQPVVAEDSARGIRVRYFLETANGLVTDAGLKLQFASGFVFVSGLQQPR